MARKTAYEWMLEELCGDLGWCGGEKDGKRVHVNDFVPESGLVTAGEFSRWVIQAEGFEPDYETFEQRKWKTQIRDLFIKYMGTDSVDAQKLRYDP